MVVVVAVVCGWVVGCAVSGHAHGGGSGGACGGGDGQDGRIRAAHLLRAAAWTSWNVMKSPVPWLLPASGLLLAAADVSLATAGAATYGLRVFCCCLMDGAALGLQGL